MENQKKVMLSGIQPSGELHLGNYLGAIKNWGARADEFDCFYFMADMHTITVRQTPAELRRGLAHGDGMHIGHKVEAVELVRPGAPVLDGPQVVAQVELAAGLDAGEHDFFLVFHSKTHLLRVIFGSLGTMPHIGLSYHIQMALTILRRKI